MKPISGLYLVGFVASGKTTIGRALAQELGWPFIDIDTEIEAREGRAIAQIFLERGEIRFREVEAEVIRQFAGGSSAVIALGGGAFVQPANRELIESKGVSVWLDCPLEMIRKRLGDDSTRPLAANRNGLEKLFAERRPLYARANHRIDVDTDDLPEIVRRVLALPIFQRAAKD
ncbi:MAG: shikimate kinase [Bryobacteraceae bacterium]